MGEVRGRDEVVSERLWTPENKLRFLEGMGMGRWFSLPMGSTEGTYCTEHGVLYTNTESWNTTSKTDVLYGHKQNNFKNK